jgi:hypothetical protein
VYIRLLGHKHGCSTPSPCTVRPLRGLRQIAETGADTLQRWKVHNSSVEYSFYICYSVLVARLVDQKRTPREQLEAKVVRALRGL